MNIRIGENIKRLRKQKELTQEDLAGFLGVTFQTVSKWERGEAYPDITLLPSVANFFEVTLDDLVGMGEIKNEKKLSEIEDAFKRNCSDGKIERNITLLREALRDFPNNYKLLSELASSLNMLQADDATEAKNKREAVEISERILAFCTDSEIRNDVQGNLCFLYDRIGEREKAVALAEKLPGIYSSDLCLSYFLSGGERVRAAQERVQALAEALRLQIRALADADCRFDTKWTAAERIAILDKINRLYEVIFEDGDYHFYHVDLAENFRTMAALALSDRQNEKALFYLEKSAGHSVAFDTLADHVPHTSLLVSELAYSKTDTSKNYAHNWSYEMLHRFLTQERYDVIRGDERFAAMTEKLREHAK